MKTKILHVVLLSGVLAFMLACSPKSDEPQVTVVDTAQIKREIQAKEDEFAATYNAREEKNIGYYAEDATTYRQNKPPLVGRAAIVEFLKADIRDFSKNNTISFTTNEIFVSNGGDQVVEIGSYKVSDSLSAAINTGNYMCLFVKRDGKYVCLREMSVSDMPLE
jgi:ketosteroid isomerase-like protein